MSDSNANHTFRSRIAGVLAAAAVFAVMAAFPRTANANEGRFSLTATGIDCEGISVWQDHQYAISGRCSGLVYPYHDQLDRYSFWIQPDSGAGPLWIGEIQRGVISGSTVKRFTNMFVTAETDSTPRQPGTVRVVSGSLSVFGFPAPYQSQTAEVSQPQPTAEPGATPAPSPTPTPATAPSFSIGNVQAMPLILIAALVLIIVGVLYTFRH